MAFRMIDTPKGPVMRLGAFVCDPAGICGDFSEDLPTKKLGKGRFSVEMPNGLGREFWVLWVDEGFRTAVLGNKEGDFGWIVDRSTKGGADRVKAAREILDFNGYDVSQLKVVK
jgi:apolipoprotein D and lipocalin family protein